MSRHGRCTGDVQPSAPHSSTLSTQKFLALGKTTCGDVGIPGLTCHHSPSAAKATSSSPGAAVMQRLCVLSPSRTCESGHQNISPSLPLPYANSASAAHHLVHCGEENRGRCNNFWP